jgi:hypothetical protein
LLRTTITAIFILAAFGQPSSAGTTSSFPALLDGGSNGVPHLPGAVTVSETRVEFEAFPQVENVALPCTSIKQALFARGHKNVVTIVSADTTYRFDLHSGPQADKFMAAITSSCTNLLRNSSAQR